MQPKKKLAIAMSLLFLSAALLNAQTAAELETVLGTPALSCAEAARFVIASAGPAEGDEYAGGESAGGGAADGAFSRALEGGWLPRGTEADEPITLGKLSLLVMKAFDIKGGLMYRLLPVPRYAFRAMVSQSYIQEASDPDMKVSGENFLNILGRVLSAKGGES